MSHPCGFQTFRYYKSCQVNPGCLKVNFLDHLPVFARVPPRSKGLQALREKVHSSFCIRETKGPRYCTGPEVIKEESKARSRWGRNKFLTRGYFDKATDT